MRSLVCFLCLSFGLLIPTAGEVSGVEPFRYKEGKHGKGELKYVNGIPVLIVEGSPKEMGEQIGVLAVRQVKPMYNFPREYFLGECAIEILRTNPTWTKEDPQFKKAIAAAEAALWPQVQKKAARLEDNFPEAQRIELDAIIKAGEVDRKQMISTNGLFDLGHVPQSELVRGCSSVIIPPSLSSTKGVLFGRNLDYYHFGYLHHYSLLMVYRSNDPKKHSFVSAGFPGFVGCFTGMNDAGLTIASHEVQEPNTTTLFNEKGVPFAMAYRRILEECATISDAVKLLEGMQRASVTSLVIADTKEGAVIEVTPDKIAVRRFKDKPGVCTNHFCTMKNPNQKEQYDTFKRFNVLTKLVEENKKNNGFGIDDIQKGLHDARLVDSDKSDLTIQTFVFEPAERKVHLRFGDGNGPATAGKLRTLDLNEFFGKDLGNADWPQWRGAQRDGTSAEKGLREKWPKDGPPLLWSIDTLGSGFSGPAVVGERLFIMGSNDDGEYLAALRVDTGRELWRVTLGPVFKNGWGHGPRGTPTVAGDRVVALGAQGVLVCVDLTTGKEQWRTDLRKDHAGRLMHGNILDVDWGYSESPLVDDGRVVVSPGGAKGTVAAFDIATGKVIWRTTTITDSASYSSIVLTEIHGIRQYVQLTGGVEYSGGAFMKTLPRAVGISPKDGSILWQHKINYTTAGVINTPVVLKDIVYTSCGYSAGCTILRIEKEAAGLKAVDITTKDARKVLAIYHGGIVPAKDRVFGFSETAGWVCQLLPSGESLWEEKRRITGGSHIRVGSRLIIVTTEGTVAMTEPNDDDWAVQGEFVLPKVSPLRKANSKIKVCTHPVVGNGRLYVRDQESFYCYDLR